MKKLLSLILVIMLCVCVLASCEAVDTVKGWFGIEPNQPGNENPPVDEEPPVEDEVPTLEDAKVVLRDLYKNKSENTAADYDVVGTVMVDTTMFTVTWKTDNINVQVIESKTEGNYTVDVIPTEPEAAIPYILTATITAPDGTSIETTFKYVVPKFQVNTWEEYCKAETGDALVVEGIVVAINSKDAGNKRNHLFILDETGVGGYYIYDMPSDPVKDHGIEVGMKVRVSGDAAPYGSAPNVLPEMKNGAPTILNNGEKVEFDFIDLTEKFVSSANFNSFVAMPVVLKDVLIGGQDLEDANHQYLYFTVNGVQSYIRTYVTDFPTSLTAADKATIDALHASKQGYIADVYGVVVTYSNNAYLMPVSVECFNNFRLPERTDTEKVALELENVEDLPENILEETVLTLPLTGTTYDTVKFIWTCDDKTVIIGEDGKVTIALGDEAKTLKFTVTATIGEGEAVVSDSKEFTVNVKAAPKGVYMGEHVEAPVAGTAYKFYLTAKDGKNYYFIGTNSGNFLQTSTNVADGVDVFLEAVLAEDGKTVGYRFYFMNGETKTYIDINTSGKAALVTENPVAVYNYVAETNIWAATVSGTEYYLGTYNDYNTIGSSKSSYINADNTGVSQFPANLATIEVVVDHVHEFGDATCTAPATCSCGATDGEALGHNIVDNACANCGAVVVTVTEGAALEDDTLVFITATVSKITYSWSDTNGNMSVDITDGTTTINAYKLATKVGIGDVITVYGKIGSYNDVKQIAAGATAEIVTAHVCSEFTEATCTVAPKCVVCNKVNGTALGHTTEDGTCERCNEVIDPNASTTVSISIADYATANSWENSTLYANIESNGVKIATSGTPVGNYGLNTGKYYTSGNNWRIYQNENPSVTVSVAEGKTIVSVKITYAIKNTGTLTLNGEAITSGTVVEVNANSVTFSVGNTGTATNGQAQITAIEVIYK